MSFLFVGIEKGTRVHSLSVEQIPEPSTALLLGLGAVALAGRGRGKRRAPAASV